MHKWLVILRPSPPIQPTRSHFREYKKARSDSKTSNKVESTPTKTQKRSKTKTSFCEKHHLCDARRSTQLRSRARSFKSKQSYNSTSGLISTQSTFIINFITDVETRKNSETTFSSAASTHEKFFQEEMLHRQQQQQQQQQLQAEEFHQDWHHQHQTKNVEKSTGLLSQHVAPNKAFP
jgi:hypothetical protein